MTTSSRPSAPGLKHAIIIGHPEPTSFTAAVGHAYADAVEALGQQAVVRDLYKLGFDPCLKASERPDMDFPTIADDVRREREAIGDCDVFVFAYPIWFGTPPAILKGYVERVFNLGFAFEGFRGGQATPLLTGRKLISFTSSGATRAFLEESGVWVSLRAIFDDYIAKVCGLEVIDHVHFPSVYPDMQDRWVEENLQTVREKVRGHFSGASGVSR